MATLDLEDVSWSTSHSLSLRKIYLELKLKALQNAKTCIALIKLIAYLGSCMPWFKCRFMWCFWCKWSVWKSNDESNKWKFLIALIAHLPSFWPRSNCSGENDQFENQITRITNAKMINFIKSNDEEYKCKNDCAPPSFRARSNCRAHSKWIQSGNAWSFPLFSFHFLMDRNQNLLLFWSDF